MGYEDKVRRVIPYTPGEQPRGKVIKLNTNECPYPPSPKVTEAIRNLEISDLRKYPDPLCSALNSAIAEHYGVNEDQVFTGVGSDDVLSMIFLTFFNGSDPVLFPNITYSFYDVWASVYGIPYKTVALREDFTLDPTEYLNTVNGGIVLANPNAPTGIAEEYSVIRDIIEANPDSMVVVDEAYIDFGGETVLPLLKDYENLIIVRTMSKSRALAGIRAGYAIANSRAIKYLNDVKYSVNSYTMNTAALVAAKAAIEDEAYFKEITEKIIKTREETKKELRELKFLFGDSKTNFVFARHEGVRPGESSSDFARRIFEGLKERGIFVRYFNKPIINEYLRITIGTEEEMKALFAALKELMA